LIDPITLSVTRLWLSMALVTFAILCYSDLKTRKVDTRRNSLMAGAGLMATIPSGLGFMYLVYVFVVFAFNKVFSKLNKQHGVKYFAKGDQSILLWALPGLILVGVAAPWVFMFVLTIVLIGISIIQGKFNEPFGKVLPGAIIMVVAFLITLGFFL